MTLFRLSWILLLATLVAGLPAPASAGQAVTNSDIQRLLDDVSEASRDIAQLRARDSAFASDLQAELDEARDEVTYLKVKLRRGEPVTLAELTELENRIAAISNRARGGSASGTTGTSPSRPAATTGRATTADPNEIPVGTEFDVTLQSALSSKTSQVEDRFEATTVVDLKQGDRVLVPAGSVMRGVVTSVNPATRLDRKGSLTVAFDQITINGRSYPIRATVIEALESEGIKGETAKIGTGAGVGAIIGGILGGVKGALAGILIGAGGTIAATEGTDVELPPGTILRVRLDTPLVVR